MWLRWFPVEDVLLGRSVPFCLGGGVPGAVEGVAVDRGLVLGLVDEDEEEVEDLGLSALLGVESVLRGFVLDAVWVYSLASASEVLLSVYR